MKNFVAIPQGKILNDKYHVDDIIGSGGMGTVYRGVQLAISRPVAIKLLHHQYLNNSKALARFRDEANIVGSVASDNICEVIDFGALNNQQPFIVMPLLRGCTLKQLTAREPISFKRALDIIQQVLLALSAVHKAGILHQDLKPENIFVTRVGDRNDFVKLLDFGIAKMFEHSLSASTRNSGRTSGTPAYMSPEQACGASTGPASDIYATGVILYELVTGKRPHQANSIGALAQKIVEAPYTAPRRINPHISKGLEEIILRALQKDPRDRFDSASSFRNALKRLKDMQSDYAVCTPALHPHATLQPVANTETMTVRETVTETLEESHELKTSSSGVMRSRKKQLTKFPKYGRTAVVVIAAGLLIAILLVAVTNREITSPAQFSPRETIPAALSKAERPARQSNIESSADRKPGLTAPAAIPLQQGAILEETNSENSDMKAPASETLVPFPVEPSSTQQPMKNRKNKRGLSASTIRNKPRDKLETGKDTIRGRFKTEILTEYRH